MGGFFMGTIENRLVNTRIASITPLEAPIHLKERIINHNAELVIKTRQEISDILNGQDTRRLLMVVGPCSIYEEEATMEYAQRLLPLKTILEDELVIAMRTYPLKPRTTVGWKGIAYEPRLDGSAKPGAGLSISRQVLADINNLGVPCTVEFLDSFTPQDLDDLVSWAAIGARTTESQPHRELASGLSMPVGFKNSTDGNIQLAVEAMVTAASSHLCYGTDEYGQRAALITTGNSDTHLILRGSRKGANYDETSIAEALRLTQEQNLLTESNRLIMIDCSHGNSAKDPKRQLNVAEKVLEQIQSGQHRIMGMMIESNLYEGQQKWVADKPLDYGVSITDGCIGWEETEQLLFTTAKKLKPKIYAVPY